MPLSLYNTLSRRLEPFEPLEPGKIRMYYCGVTVYDYCHVGHARACVVWDVVRRYLVWRGYEVRYVQNFTDIDDKILKRSRQEKSTMEAVAERYIQAYFEDMARLNVKEADEYPRATHTLDGIKRLIHELETRGFAYPSAGDVYYSVKKFADYGKLSGQKVDERQTGASGRVSEPEDAQKQDPADFALWKSAKPGEPAWESPWGNGRPGWHIECSAMVRDRLGETIDIHAGGNDLIFPHHENEIAQSEAVTGKPLARYWLHNGMVNVNGEKMSKSLGNFTTIRQMLDAPNAPDPMAVRMFILQANYRKPIDFTDEGIAAAQNGWAVLQDGLRFGGEYGDRLGWAGNVAPQADAIAHFRAAMDDDFNTSSALAVLFGLAKQLERARNLLIHEGTAGDPTAVLESQWLTLVDLAGVLGLEAQPESQERADSLSEAAIAALIAERTEAKKTKNFAEADRIRNELQAQGIQLIDKPGGLTLWHRV
ncbi:cysteine--tRNA ligase [Myxacorys almedinensis]|uniref:Cysteine--tRNA ligase n=1 Tax=Myxacorys almedinensis A TaxID=2690445 RepID=A0A8J7Z1L0_9CYAN|nr:cysteine--tRNA ligase [Myxacorys almedinensis]NDJ17964.1 cysteine--tRNA ligase [Myxacorys almedinensis A]